MEDRLVAARKLVGELVKEEQIEVRRAEIVGRDLAKHVETLGRPPSGHELEAWLGDHNQVTELYASTSLLEELVYRYLTPPPPDVPISESEQRHPELEKQIRDALATPEPYLVYADWLQERADPFGELLALGVAATKSGSEEDQLRFERYRKLHEVRFLNGVKLKGIELTWRNGVVSAIEELEGVDTIPLATWETLLRLRVCEYVESIALRRSCTNDLDRLIEQYGARTLRDVSLDGYQHWPELLMRRDLRSVDVTMHRFTLKRDWFPASLEILAIAAVEYVVETSAPLPVRELRFTLNDSSADAIPQLKLPNVERLGMFVGASFTGKLTKVLESFELPALKQLSIRGGVLDAKTFGKLAKLPLAKHLETLVLTELEITDDAMQAMTRTKRAFEALQTIDLSHNELSRAGLEAAKALAPTIVSSRQNRPGDGVEKRIRKMAGTRLTVAEEIAHPKDWKRSGMDGDARWARYKGEFDDYELFVMRDLSEYGCTCPSSYQPCKHVIALALLAERGHVSEAKSDGIEGRVRERNAERARERERINQQFFNDVSE